MAARPQGRHVQEPLTHSMHLHTSRIAFSRTLAAALVFLTALTTPAAAHAQTSLPTVTPDPTISASAPASVGTSAQTYVPGELLVGVRADAPVSVQTMSAAEAMGVTVLQTIDVPNPDANLVIQRVSTVPGEEYATAAVIAQQPGVVYVEPNFYVYAADMLPQAPTQSPTADGDAFVTPAEALSHVQQPFAVNDPLYASRQWNMQRVSASRAWQLTFDSGHFGSPSDEIVVSVIDSGIDTQHPEFTGRLLPGYDYVDAGAMEDTCGHGTHVAGIIAAGLNDNTGVAGMAPMVRIDPRRVLKGDCSGTVSAVATGIISAAVAGADVINMSIQVGIDLQTLREAVEFAADQGALLIAAAGNNQFRIAPVAYPGKYPQVMAVAALGYDDQRASYSNVGPEVEIAAPGGEVAVDKILSAWPSQALNRCGSSGGLITMGQPGIPYYYCAASGTSQAAPLVAGVGALLLALDPSLSAEEVRNILVDTATPLDEAAIYVGAGKVDAAAAVRALTPGDILLTPTTYVSEVISSTTPFTITVRIDNPSLTPIDFAAVLAPVTVQSATVGGPPLPKEPTITLTSGVGDQQSGTAAFGAPAFATLQVTPATGWNGVLSATLSVTAAGSAVSPIRRATGIVISFNQSLARWFFPMVFENATAVSIAAASNESTWLSPADESQRITYAMTDTSESPVVLPFAFPLGNASYATVRLFSDGFLVVPDATDAGATWPFVPAENLCLPQVGYPPQGVFGWWSDLDPSAGDASTRVSSFPLAADRYVVEFRDVPSAGENPYTVSFQMVLHQSGAVSLHYGDVPEFVGAPGPVTIGVEGTDSRFFSQIACATDEAIVGWLPADGESLLVTPEDVY